MTEGSATASIREVGDLRITGAFFPARDTIPPHTHDRPCLAFMLGGSFDLSFPGRRADYCVPGSVFIEPAGETHCNCMGAAGARVVVLQPDPDAAWLPRDTARALLRPAHFRNPGLSALARRMELELARPDDLSPLALEGLALEMLVRIGRGQRESTGDPPRWLQDAEALLRARFREPLTVAQVAAAVRVHPAHLARSFRLRHRVSIGRFIRLLRFEYAVQQLASTRQPIASIAAEAGYADQSHFTRTFREITGTTPHRWRRSSRVR